MIDYIIKRLFWMTFTIFGIMVITFCVTRLAPGDPALLKLQAMGQASARNQQLSQQLIEDTRKLYGFDRPLIFNLKNENVKTNTYNLAKDLTSANEYTKQFAYNQLLEIGAAVIPYLTQLLNDQEFFNQYDTLLEILATLTAFNFPPESATSDKIDLWKKHYSETSQLYSSDYHIQLVRKILEGNDESKLESQTKLLKAGSSALDTILSLGFKNKYRNSADLFNLAAQITKKSWFIVPGMTEKEKKAVIRNWESWWKNEKYKYSFFNAWEKFINIFSATQFGKWFSMVLSLDFGESYSYHVPVTDLIKERLPVSLQLSLISIFITYIIAIPLGVFSATHQYTMSDKIITVILFILYSLPSFWLANMLILFTTGGDFPMIFPSRYLHSPGAETFPFFKWFLDWIWHLILPITCLTYAGFAYVSRQMRVGMLDIIRQDFIRTARAKGLSERSVIFRHALRNALIPTVTLLAYLLPALLGGSVIIEEIFTIEGMGKLSFEAILNRDYPIINAIAFFSAFLTLIGMLLTDIAYVFVDPRITFEK